MSTPKLTFPLAGLGCFDCVVVIENAVMRLPGVAYVGVSLEGMSLTVRPSAGFDVERMLITIEKLGYGVGPKEQPVPRGGTGCSCLGPRPREAAF